MLERTTYNGVHRIWSGPSKKSLYANELTIGEIIFRQLQNDSHRIWQISHSEKTRLTRLQVLQNAIKIATYLSQEEFNQQTDIVAICARNTTQLAALVYGCMFNGTPFHALNIQEEERTLCHLLGVSKARFLVCDAQDYDKMSHVASTVGLKLYTIHGHVAGVKSIEDILNTQAICEDYQPQSFNNGIDRILAILCSSGSSGMPKAVTVSNSRRIFETHSYLSQYDIHYTPNTLNWISGLTSLITAGVYGHLRIISSEDFHPAQFLIMCEEHKLTSAGFANLHLAMLANSLDIKPNRLDNLRHLRFGGGHIMETNLEKLRSYLPKAEVLRISYGLSELSTVSINCNTHKKPKSVGFLVPNIRMRVVSDAGEFLGPNEIGELYCHHGEHWSGYFKDLDATMEMQDSKGWFHTGDLGYFDGDNYLHIVDRKKNMLTCIFMTYFPQEIEQLISQLPEVSNVCVFGIFNELTGDNAAAAVVLKRGSQLDAFRIRDFVAQHIGACFKQLHGGVQIVPHLIQCANGKIDRKANKAAYLKAVLQSNRSEASA